MRRISRLGVSDRLTASKAVGGERKTCLGTGAYVVTTKVLGGTTLEGMVAGGVTFLVTKGGSKLIRWLF